MADLVPGRDGTSTLGGPALSVVVPCYNEAEGLAELHRRVVAAVTPHFGDDFEIVLVNDGSRDATWAGMVALSDADPRVLAVNLARNHGHQLALTAGLGQAAGELIFILDADLQDPPELIGPMLELVRAGNDVVYGQRRKRDGETAFKRATASVFYRLLDRLVDVDIPRDTGDFRLMTRRVLNVLQAMPERYRFVRGMVSWVGFKQAPLPYDREARFAGETKYPLHKMISFAIDAITSFSVAPLRIASWMGVCAGLGAMLMLAYVLGAWVMGYAISGWTSTLAIILVLGSTQLMILGIMGEYLGRMYMEAKRRPLYIIDEVHGVRGARGNAVHHLHDTILERVNG
jgi:dolichol-phosphate mannosyltransferase